MSEKPVAFPVASRARKVKLALKASVLLAVTAGAWVVFESSFFHGLIVGLYGAVIALVGGMFLLTRRLKKRMSETLKPPPIPDEVWDYDMSGTDLEDVERDFSDFKGRVLVLNFWATWCAPCVVEMPSLQSLRDRTAAFDVDFAMVTNEEADVVRTMVEKRGWDLPVIRVTGDRPEYLSAHAIPATFIIGKNGRIAMRHVGSAKWDADEMVTFVQGLAVTPD
jgi:thiol-disulfide isomerase/thioredoxin